MTYEKTRLDSLGGEATWREVARGWKELAESKWQPIETAPKTGKILMWVRGEIFEAKWSFANLRNQDGDVYDWMSNGHQLNSPSHWMHRPPDPE